MARADRPTTNAPVSAIQIVSRLKHRIGLRRSVELRSAVSGGELALSGVWSSVMILPQGLSESLTESEMEAVLLHELLHAKRWDNLAAVFIHTLVCLFWFHPILWIERKLIAERELACDEAVIAHGSSAKEYTAGILKVCRFHLIELQPSVCGATGSNLRKRMELIMSYSSGRFAQRRSRLILSLLGALMTVEPFAMGFLQAPVLYGRVDGDERQSKTGRYSKDGELRCQ